MKIHNVFHSSLLKPYYSDGSYQPPAPTVFDDKHLEYTVERVLDHRDKVYKHKLRKEYHVHWKGFGPEHNTWEPESFLTNSSDLVSEYWMQGQESQLAQLALLLEKQPVNSGDGRMHNSDDLTIVLHSLCILRGICKCKCWAFCLTNSCLERCHSN